MILEFIYWGRVIATKEIKEKPNWDALRRRYEVNLAIEEMRQVQGSKVVNTDKWEIILHIRSKVEFIEVAEEFNLPPRFFNSNQCPITGFAK